MQLKMFSGAMNSAAKAEPAKFIDKVLGEMKSQFNKNEKNDASATCNEKKPETVVLKRSSLRRSRDNHESILQSAIARKEKLYESNKPQRTRKKTTNLQLRSSKKQKQENGSSSTSTTDDITSNNKRKRTKTETINKKELKQKNAKNCNVPDFKFNKDCVLKKEEKGEEVQIQTKNQKYKSKEKKCLCTENSNIYFSKEYISSSNQICTALDSFDSKIYSCNNKITTTTNNLCLIRPSTRIPYMKLCELHFERMLKHQCCSICGLFCTQGSFFCCENKHLYHVDCSSSLSKTKTTTTTTEAKNVVCLHCDSSKICKVKIKLADDVKYRIFNDNNSQHIKIQTTT